MFYLKTLNLISPEKKLENKNHYENLENLVIFNNETCQVVKLLF